MYSHKKGQHKNGQNTLSQAPLSAAARTWIDGRRCPRILHALSRVAASRWSGPPAAVCPATRRPRRRAAAVVEETLRLSIRELRSGCTVGKAAAPLAPTDRRQRACLAKTNGAPALSGQTPNQASWALVARPMKASPRRAMGSCFQASGSTSRSRSGRTASGFSSPRSRADCRDLAGDRVEVVLPELKHLAFL